MPMSAHSPWVRALIVAVLLASGPSVAATPSSRTGLDGVGPSREPVTIQEQMRAVIAAVCGAADPTPSALTLPLGGAIELAREPLRNRDRVMGTRTR